MSLLIRTPQVCRLLSPEHITPRGRLIDETRYTLRISDGVTVLLYFQLAESLPQELHRNERLQLVFPYHLDVARPSCPRVAAHWFFYS